MAVEVTTVWQIVEATASAYKVSETCHFVGLKKKKSHCYSLRFLRKAPTKKSLEKECF